MKRNSSPENRVRQVTSLYVAIIGAVCLFFVLFSREVIVTITPENYHGAAVYLPLLLISYLLTGYYYFASMPLFYHKKTLQLPIITITAAAANVVLNLWWAPRWGALGATWATVIAVALMLVLSHILGQRLQHLQQPLGRYGLLTALIMLAAFLTTYGPLQETSALTLLTKLLFFGTFGIIAFYWLVRPNLSPSDLAGAAPALGNSI